MQGALALAGEGVDVVLLARNAADLDTAATAIAARTGRPSRSRATRATMRPVRAAAPAVAALGGIDIYQCRGATRGQAKPPALGEISPTIIFGPT
ncbi:MAG: hypothetical protein R3E48_23260 [Burkholderiaceae bacterium]